MRAAWRSITAPGVGAELVAALDEQVADAIEELSGKRPGADPCGVGLGDPDHPADVARADASARAGASGHWVGRRHVGIRAVVEIEEGGLRPFEQNVLTGLESIVDQAHRVGDVGRQSRGIAVEVALGDVVGRQRESVVDAGQDGVLLLEDLVELGPEDFGVEQILHAQARPQCLVGVGGTDAAPSRAELVAAEAALGDEIDLLVVREDQVGVARHA